MGIIEVTKDSIEKLKILEWSLVIELDEGEVAHERRSVETIHDVLNLGRTQRWRLGEKLSRCGRGGKDATVWQACLTIIVEHFR